jgi:O-antigen/teichoic acid export membrane protein
MAFAPIVTRLYGTEAFGAANAFLAIGTTLAPLASLHYAPAISMPAEDADARELARLGTRVALLVAGVATLLGVLFGTQLGNALGFGALAGYLWVVGPFLGLAGLEQCLAQWLVRKRRFRAIGMVATGQAVGVGGARAGIGMVSATPLALVFTATAGKAVQTALLWIAGRDVFSGQGEADRHARIRRRRQLAEQFKDFPLFRLPQALLSALSKNFPMLLFSGLFGPAIAGFYAIGQRIMQLPILLISRAVGTVILPRFAASTQGGRSLRPEIVKATLGLAVVGLVPFGVVFIWGPPLFAFAFGPEWWEAGLYARWLAPWLFLGFMNVPSVQSLPFTNSQGFLLVWESVTTVGKFALVIGVATATGDPLLTIQWYALFGAGAYLYLIFESIRRSGKHDRMRAL